jgi:hypothetical protein
MFPCDRGLTGRAKQTAILPHDERFILSPAHPETGLAQEYPARE